jgi:hypothetical protein
MSAWVPLLQTAVWVGLIVWLVLRYKEQATSILVAVQKRIEHGSSVKAGPFEIGESVKTQSLPEQKARLHDEANDSGESAVITPPKLRTERTKHLLVEELAIRKVQAEFGTPVTRQVTIGHGIGLDGMFTKGGAAFGIEVKYIRNEQFHHHWIAAMDRVFRSIENLGWRRFTFIFVVVFERRELMSPAMLQGIQREMADYGEKVIVRYYALVDLEADFGISLEERLPNALMESRQP